MALQARNFVCPISPECLAYPILRCSTGPAHVTCLLSDGARSAAPAAGVLDFDEFCELIGPQLSEKETPSEIDRGFELLAGRAFVRSPRTLVNSIPLFYAGV